MLRALKHVAWTGLAAGLLGLGTTPALGQAVGGPGGPPLMPTTPQTPPTTNPQPNIPTPSTNAPTPEATNPGLDMGNAGLDVASLGGGSSLGLGGGTASFAAPGGYLDNAIPMTLFRLRYDAAFNLNRPDRAEFFYAAWRELSFHTHGIMRDGKFVGTFFDPHARGSELLPGRLDYQELSSYFEFAYNNRLSGFLNVPVRFVDFDNLQEDGTPEDRAKNPNGTFKFPEPREENLGAPHTNLGGLSDIVAGFKYALIADPDRYLTFQLQAFFPSGDAENGLGTGHYSLEPGLLYYRHAGRLELQGQLMDWIPLNGGPMAGNVLIYGAGVGYDIYQCAGWRVVPIAEFVGWTVLSGFESFEGPVTPPPDVVVPTTHGVQDASGDTIVDAKVGVRTYFPHGSDLYVGYGRSLTGDRWYEDIVRVEYRFKF